MAVQFSPLSGLRSPQFGLLWHEVRGRYPQVDELPELPPMEEITLSERVSTVRIVEGAAATRRQWFLDMQGTHVLQLQRDRIAHNWRRLSEDARYPSFDGVLTAFREDWMQFEDFASRENLGQLLPEQCELTYVDQIDVGEACPVRHLGALGDLLCFWKKDFSLRGLGEPSFATCQVRFRSDHTNQGYIDLAIEVAPAKYIKGDRTILLMKTIARGAPTSVNWAGVDAFMQRAHGMTSSAFLSITTPEARQSWMEAGT